MQLYLAARVGRVPWPRRRSMAGIGRYTNLACSLPHTPRRSRARFLVPGTDSRLSPDAPRCVASSIDARGEALS